MSLEGMQLVQDAVRRLVLGAIDGLLAISSVFVILLIPRFLAHVIVQAVVWKEGHDAISLLAVEHRRLGPPTLQIARWRWGQQRGLVLRWRWRRLGTPALQHDWVQCGDDERLAL